MEARQLYADLAAEQKQSLTSPGAREVFTELCEAGCLQLVLAAIVALLRYSSHLQVFWTEMAGRPDNREKTTRILESAAETLENLFGSVIALENDGKGTEFIKIGRLPFSRVVSELRFYIKFINIANLLRADTEIRSPAELAKHLLTSYVRALTGDFHDRCVSGVIGKLTGSPYYSEEA
jgi:hypothetical protein